MIEETRQKKTKQKLKKKNEIKLCLIKRIQANFYFFVVIFFLQFFSILNELIQSYLVWPDIYPTKSTSPPSSRVILSSSAIKNEY